MQDFNVLLEAASDYNEFVGSGAEEDRNALRHFEGLANEALPDDVISKLSQLPGSYSILVAAEMWCPDCHKNLPVIHAIAASAPAIQKQREILQPAKRRCHLPSGCKYLFAFRLSV